MKETLRTYHEANRYTQIFRGEDALVTKKVHIENVIKIALAIADFQHSKLDRELLAVFAEHHDDGRVRQYELLGKFWDTEVTHFALGVDRVDNFINSEGLVVDEEIALLRKVMMYHGRMHLMAEATEEEREYVELISAADDFENATSCVSYLIREIKTDAKGYVSENPKQDQKQVTDDMIWNCYENGQKFDKFKYCHTYADYILLAGTLATSCIVKYGNIATAALSQPGYGYESILKGFKKTFEYALTAKDAEKAYSILKKLVTGCFFTPVTKFRNNKENGKG